jgi:hypothetical protein
VAAEDAAAVAALLAPGPRLRRVLEAASFQDGDVRTAWCATDAGGSFHALHLRRLAGRCAELASRAVRAEDDRLDWLLVVVASSTVRYARQPRSPAACSRPHSTHIRPSVRSGFTAAETTVI